MIRPATFADAPAIARVHVCSWEETYRGILPDTALDTRTLDVRIAHWRDWLSRTRRWTFVSEEHGEVNGFACAFTSDEEPGFDAVLSTLYVLRNAQRRGIARALLRAVASELLRAKLRSMWLITLRDGNPARVFYERVGAELLREAPAPPNLGAGVMDAVYGFRDVAILCSPCH
jgi:ribosomal protein S18 acetylase RimI-like enzyme